MEMRAPARINRERYGRLLLEKLPRPIRNDRDLERAETELLALDEKGNDLTPEEGEYFDMLAVLIEDYENKHYPVPTVPGSKALKELMFERGLRHKDIAAIVGNKGLTTEILAGRRGISKTVARKLAERLQVPIDLFL
jgi:HTH-type transcriptional regulator/antitoxin HigA